MSASPAIAVIGAGRFAQGVLRTLVREGIPVVLWSRRSEAVEAVQASLGAGERALCAAAPTVQDAVARTAAAILAVPISGLRTIAAAIGEVAQGDSVVLHAIRGVEHGFVLPHQVIRAQSCVRRMGVLGGPIYAPELAAGKAIAAVLATRFAEPLAVAQRLTAATPLRLHRSDDLIGVEVAGAIANVVTLAVGMADALGLGPTSRGLLVTRGLMEAAALAVHCGGRASTLVGLAGVGDMVPRQVATTSRHLRVGSLLAQGMALPTALSQVGGCVDGIGTAQAAARLATDAGLLLPLIEAVASVASGEHRADKVLAEVLHLDIDPAEALLNDSQFTTALHP